MVASTPVAVVSAAGVLIAAVAFVATSGSQPSTASPRADETSSVRTSATATATPTGTPSAGATTPSKAPVVRHRHHRRAHVVHRGSVYVEVFNNSGITGLAGSTAARAQGAGWQVVGSGNWYGTIAASTVYYPPRLKAAARLLARDLGVRRVHAAIAPMRGDRLTVILTADYA